MHVASVNSNFVSFSDSDNHTFFSFQCPKAESQFFFDLTPNRLILLVIHQSSLRFYSLDEKSEFFDFFYIRDAIHENYAKTLLNLDFDNCELCEYVDHISYIAKKLFG